MIFDDMPFDGGLETVRSALQLVLKRKKVLSLPDPWSYVELQPDEADSNWLRNWASHLKASTIAVAVRRDMNPEDKRITAEGGPYDWQVGLGMLLLFTGADRGRRDAPTGEIWPTLYDALRGQGVQALLFQKQNASRLLRDLIRFAAEKLELRHDFDFEGGQHCYITFLLQFGFSHRAFYGNPETKGADTKLPYWLARQKGGIATVSIDLLLGDEELRSLSFYQLWRAMAEFRRGERDESSLRDVLRNNVWVLPQWSDDLVVCLKKKRGLEAQLPQMSRDLITPAAAPLAVPRLQWNAGAPRFEFDLSPQCTLSSQHEMLTLILSPEGSPEHELRLTRQPNGNYSPTLSSPLVAPAQCMNATAEVIDPDGVTIWGETYMLWDGADDVNVFLLSTGERLKDVANDEMKLQAGYILFVDDGLRISDTSLKWKALPNSNAIAYLLPSGWSDMLEVRSCDENDLVWKPKIASRTQYPLPATVCLDTKEQHFGEGVRFRVNCWEGVTLEAAFCGSNPLVRSPLPDGAYLLKGAYLSPQNPRSRMTLKLIFHRNGVPETHEISVKLNPAGMLMRKNEAHVWNVRKEEELDAYATRRNEFRIFAPQRETGEFRGEWTLWEGETPHGSVARYWKDIPSFDGLGAPFTAQTGECNEECLPLAASVVDRGVIKQYSISTDENGMRWLTISLRHPIPITDGLEIRWWDEWWKVLSWKPDNSPNGSKWRISLDPACHGKPLALAIALNGERLGALWSKRWYTDNALFRLGSERETARNLRWLRLPVLLPAASDRMEQFVSYARPILYSLWLEDEDTPEWRFNSGQIDSWKRAARILLNLEEE